MIEDFLEKVYTLNKPYFAYFHCMETHPPFYPPGWDKKEKPGSPAEWVAKRKAAIEFVDKVIEPLLKIECDDLVITADHNIEHDLPNTKALNVFIAMRVDGEVVK